MPFDREGPVEQRKFPDLFVIKTQDSLRSITAWINCNVVEVTVGIVTREVQVGRL